MYGSTIPRDEDLREQVRFASLPSSPLGRDEPQPLPHPMYWLASTSKRSRSDLSIKSAGQPQPGTQQSGGQHPQAAAPPSSSSSPHHSSTPSYITRPIPPYNPLKRGPDPTAIDGQPTAKRQQQQQQQHREAPVRARRARVVAPRMDPHEDFHQQRQSEAKKNVAIIEELLDKMRYDSDQELILNFLDEAALTTSRMCKALAQSEVDQDRLRDHRNAAIAQFQQCKAGYEALLEERRIQQHQEAGIRRGGPAVKVGGKERDDDDDSISSASNMS